MLVHPSSPALNAFESQTQKNTRNSLPSSQKTKVGRWERALVLLESMRAQHIWPNVVSYSAAISACEKKGEWQQALQLLEAMHEHRVSPNDITFNSAISSCELYGQWLVAVDLLRLMPALQVSPDVISFNSALTSCEGTGFWQLALSMLLEMRLLHLAPNIRSCNSVMNTLQADGQWQRACGLLSFMKVKVISPDVTTCSRAIDCCERARRWQLVAGLVCSMQEFNLQKMLDTMYTDHARFLCRQSIAGLKKGLCMPSDGSAGNARTGLCFSCFCGQGCMILVCGTDGFVESMAGPIERIKLPEGGKRRDFVSAPWALGTRRNHKSSQEDAGQARWFARRAPASRQLSSMDVSLSCLFCKM